MNANRHTAISKGRSYQAIGEFWGSRDLGDFWEQTRPVRFKVATRSASTYYPLEPKIAAKLRAVAQQRGISAETLVNLSLQERLAEAEAA